MKRDKKWRTYFLYIGIVFLVVLFSRCASSKVPQNSGRTLDIAIRTMAEEIESRFSANTRIAIVDIDSPDQRLSEYIIDELSIALSRNGSLIVVARRNVDFIRNELQYHASGEVSDETAQSIGKFLGAETIIIGSLTNIGDIYRLKIMPLNVEKGTLEAAPYPVEIDNDRYLRQLIDSLQNRKPAVIVASVNQNHVPKTAGEFFDRGLTFALAGDYESAIADFSDTIKLDKNFALAYLQRAKARIIPFVRVNTAVDIDSNFDFDSYITKVDLTNRTIRNAFDTALADFSKAIELNPNLAMAYLYRGVTYIDMNDHDKAISDYTQAIRLNPNLLKAYIYRSSAYTNKGDYVRDMEDANRALRIDPSSWHAYRNRAVVFWWHGDAKNTIADFEQAINLASTDKLKNDLIKQLNEARNYFGIRK